MRVSLASVGDPEDCIVLDIYLAATEIRAGHYPSGCTTDITHTNMMPLLVPTVLTGAVEESEN